MEMAGFFFTPNPGTYTFSTYNQRCSYMKLNGKDMVSLCVIFRHQPSFYPFRSYASVTLTPVGGLSGRWQWTLMRTELGRCIAPRSVSSYAWFPDSACTCVCATCYTALSIVLVPLWFSQSSCALSAADER